MYKKSKRKPLNRLKTNDRNETAHNNWNKKQLVERDWWMQCS